MTASIGRRLFHRKYRVKCAAVLMLCALLLPSVATAEVERGVVAETGLRYWEWRDEGVLLRLTQRLPDQTRAFFMARGFRAEDADYVARRCVFQTIFKNVSPAGAGAVEFNLDDWVVEAGEAPRKLLTREHWRALWRQRAVPQPARIAFEWSLLPTYQRYQSGDFNWGMTSYDLPPGGQFDLEFRWSRDGARHHGRIEDVQCPTDLHPNPQAWKAEW